MSEMVKPLCIIIMVSAYCVSAKDIWDIFNSFEQSKVSESLLNDFEKVKNKIVLSLVNDEMNRKRLESMPFVPYLDLAITFNVLLDRTENGERTSSKIMWRWEENTTEKNW